jgi:hypothetical protein
LKLNHVLDVWLGRVAFFWCIANTNVSNGRMRMVCDLRLEKLGQNDYFCGKGPQTNNNGKLKVVEILTHRWQHSRVSWVWDFSHFLDDWMTVQTMDWHWTGLVNKKTAWISGL